MLGEAVPITAGDLVMETLLGVLDTNTQVAYQKVVGDIDIGLAANVIVELPMMVAINL